MTPDLKELERLARAATPGPWAINTAGIAKRGEPFKITEIYVYAPETQDDTAICADVIDPVTQEPSEANAAYIAAANPAAILSLIAELTRPETTIVSIMRAELEQARKDAERYRWLQPALISGGALDDDHTLTKAFQHMTTIPTKEEFNAAIDAAIAKEQTK